MNGSITQPGRGSSPVGLCHRFRRPRDLAPPRGRKRIGPHKPTSRQSARTRPMSGYIDVTDARFGSLSSGPPRSIQDSKAEESGHRDISRPRPPGHASYCPIRTSDPPEHTMGSELGSALESEIICSSCDPMITICHQEKVEMLAGARLPRPNRQTRGARQRAPLADRVPGAKRLVETGRARATLAPISADTPGARRA